MFAGENVVVLDLETQCSADDCRYCGLPLAAFDSGVVCKNDNGHGTIGWNNLPALGLSIGCYWNYRDSRIHWFDVHTLEATMRHLVATQPLLVSFNGLAFDFPLMRGLLRRLADALLQCQEVGENQLDADELIALCDTFKVQCMRSYDLLNEIWRLDPVRKFERGLNSLDAIAQANGFGAKLSSGAQAPRDWRAGQVATVLNYCQDDVYKTKALFEMICKEQSITRGDGSTLALPRPTLPS